MSEQDEEIFEVLHDVKAVAQDANDERELENRISRIVLKILKDRDAARWRNQLKGIIAEAAKTIWTGRKQVEGNRKGGITGLAKTVSGAVEKMFKSIGGALKQAARTLGGASRAVVLTTADWFYIGAKSVQRNAEKFAANFEHEVRTRTIRVASSLRGAAAGKSDKKEFLADGLRGRDLELEDARHARKGDRIDDAYAEFMSTKSFSNPYRSRNDITVSAAQRLGEAGKTLRSAGVRAAGGVKSSGRAVGSATSGAFRSVSSSVRSAASSVGSRLGRGARGH